MCVHGETSSSRWLGLSNGPTNVMKTRGFEYEAWGAFAVELRGLEPLATGPRSRREVAKTWRFTDVIDTHLDERLALLYQRADLSPARASGPGV
jgi:hypothetical protein